MSNREFEVIVQVVASERKIVMACVQQRISPSPLLFLLVLNDFLRYSKNNIALFANDAAIYTVSDTPRITNPRMNRHLKLESKYLHLWKLKLNPRKTELINMNYKRNISNLQIIKYDNTLIKEVSELKYFIKIKIYSSPRLLNCTET